MVTITEANNVSTPPTHFPSFSFLFLPFFPCKATKLHNYICYNPVPNPPFISLDPRNSTCQRSPDRPDTLYNRLDPPKDVQISQQPPDVPLLHLKDLIY